MVWNIQFGFNVSNLLDKKKSDIFVPNFSDTIFEIICFVTIFWVYTVLTQFGKSQ